MTITENRALKIRTRAKADPEFCNKLIKLGALRDQFTYPSMESSMLLRPAMLEFAQEAGLLEQVHNQETVDELIEWLLENIDELAYYAKPVEKLKPGQMYQQPIGNAFLSWTVKSPRDREAIIGIKKALDYFNVEYFDYTQHQLDNSRDVSEEIMQQLYGAVNNANITIEVLSSEIGSSWISFERSLIKKSNVKHRFFVCLDMESAFYMTLEPSEEKRVFRLNMSEGRSRVISTRDADRWMAGAADTRYYQSKEFLLQCFSLSSHIRKLLNQNEASGWLIRFLDSITFRRSQERDEFLRHAMK